MGNFPVLVSWHQIMMVVYAEQSRPTITVVFKKKNAGSFHVHLETNSFILTWQFGREFYTAHVLHQF